MKTLPSFAALAAPLVLSALASTAEAASVVSQITAATVFADRAVVMRSGRVELTAGEAELTFEKLPAALLDQSLQVSGRGAAGATILDVNARQTFVAETSNPRVKAIEDEIAAERKKIRALDDRATALDQQHTLLAKIENAVTAPPAKDSAAPRIGSDEWRKLLEFSDETRTKLAAERQKLETDREELQAKLTALEAQLGELRGRAGAGRSYKTVTVRVAAANAGALDLTLAYAVPGASWTPAYDARLRGEERAVELSYFGLVRQNTGEDWKSVALTLSTARPSLGGGAPELQPWWVDVDDGRRYESARAKARDVGAQTLERLQSFNAALPAPASEPVVTLATAAVDSAATSASFVVAAPATILSDNATQRVGIATSKFPATLQYQATPRLLEAAFLSAHVVNASDYPLLAGGVNTFLGDAFVATSALKTVMPGEKFELALGADEGIAVKRKVVNRFSEDTGLTGSGRRVTYEFLVTLTNNKKTPERVVFKELLPVSRNEKIVVKLLGPAERDVGTPTAPKEVTREADGKLVWRLDLKPGEKREVPLKFSVEHPAELRVTGLE
jgi:uncharacterized protein (TIGR02231 family)